ncbi:MAG: glycosyltransferase family 4 protein [Gammaproteobacteria bacterium]
MNYFITPDLKSISGGNKYDLNVIDYLNTHRCKIINVMLKDINLLSYKFFFKINMIPKNSTLLIDGLVASKMNYLIKILSKKYNIILLIHHPVSYEENKNGDISSKLKERKVFSHAKRIITVSHTMKKIIKNMLTKNKNIDVIYPGVDNIYYQNKITNLNINHNIATTGSVIPRKNIEKCIETLSHLSEKWTLSIFGGFYDSDPYYKNLISKINYYNLENRVVFHNTIDDEKILIEHLKNSRVYLCLSKYEGYGMANIESATIGLPLVVADLPVFRENLRGFNRTYTDSKSPRAVADAIIKTSFDDNHINLRTRSWEDVGSSFKQVLNG